ncbi:prolyl aminopeptidase [Mycena latifolia]|nr:prolyl aminopeptidase [Mycena latifolia]
MLINVVRCSGRFQEACVDEIRWRLRANCNIDEAPCQKQTQITDSLWIGLVQRQAPVARSPVGLYMRFLNKFTFSATKHLKRTTSLLATLSKDASFWTIDLFINELENLLAFFKVTECFDILGHSWGGMLASEFIVRRQPRGLRRLVIANALASAQRRNEEGVRLRSGLPEDIQETLKKHEAEGTTKLEEYKAAMMVFYAKYACRLQPFPPEFVHSVSLADEDPTVLDTMRNGSEGLASRWDITDRIPLMRHVPTLLINGEYDYMTDSVCAPFYWSIDHVKWVKFANSSHTPHWEERERCMTVVGELLDNGEA